MKGRLSLNAEWGGELELDSGLISGPAPGTQRVTGASLPKPQIISLCHVPPNSDSGSVLLLQGAQQNTVTH